MNEAEALRVMSALAQSTRMRVFVMLTRAGDAGMGSSEIADAVGVPRNLMSSHLAILSKAGIILARKAGRSVTYTAVREIVIALGDHLRDLGAGGASEEPA
ncbi:metalloregulator ArsR/SmtB family transcription factor [Sphingomonas sp. PP-CC-3G-468]|uniref:ArsR/SmtB family transcription factor n=1 Tax=Sphingomonas sp. PP-CC-3G-468 TaxID=2135656 RepID=UPI0014048FB7|nr:metalloregulator ArsR/SmtB family transcription factor [Sphingomonas sp. PP-CC-3G-468]